MVAGLLVRLDAACPRYRLLTTHRFKPWSASKRIATAHSPSFKRVRDSNPRTVRITSYLQVDVDGWSYPRNLAALE